MKNKNLLLTHKNLRYFIYDEYYFLQIKEVRKELTRYEGEISGIKAGAKRSIKLKY